METWLLNHPEKKKQKGNAIKSIKTTEEIEAETTFCSIRDWKSVAIEN